MGLDLIPASKPQGCMAGIPDLSFELAAGVAPVCGVDEAGRGPWAGPVVAAAVILDAARIPPGLNDSKKLNEKKREALFPAIMESAVVGVGIADVERIDRDNILAATLWAMQQAVDQLAVKPQLALIDGNRPPKLACRVQTIIDGDALSLSVAAASIIAKVTRDRMMIDLDVQYPAYGFAAHKGYGTAAHQTALANFGPAPCHRQSFAPVRALIQR